MKMKARVSAICPVVIATAIGLQVYADNLRWLSTVYDFGTIKEQSGKAKGKVQFVNEGPDPTLIQRVKSTCGCTGVKYSEDLIEPGDTATVWFDYNPTGRPGRFEKHIKVYTGENSDLTSITIKGTVIGAPQSLSTRYPKEYGPMRLSADLIPMGETLYGKARHEYIQGYNQGMDTLYLSWGEVPRYLSLGASNRAVAPGDLFTLSAYLNTRDGVDVGTLDVPVSLYARSGSERVEAVIHVTASVKPDLSALSGQDLREAPSANIYPTSIDAGTLPERSGKNLKIEFNVQNDGGSPLHLRRVHSPYNPGLLKIKSMPATLKPKDIGKVRGTLDIQELPAGPFKIEVEVVTDDPIHPVRTLHIIGTKG